MTRHEMEARTRRFALDAIRFCTGLPATDEHRVIKRQLLRSATSVGANYRAAQRGRSRAEFVAKLGVVVEEADETGYWLGLLEELPGVDVPWAQRLRREADEITAIVATARNTAKRRP